MFYGVSLRRSMNCRHMVRRYVSAIGRAVSLIVFGPEGCRAHALAGLRVNVDRGLPSFGSESTRLSVFAGCC